MTKRKAQLRIPEFVGEWSVMDHPRDPDYWCTVADLQKCKKPLIGTIYFVSLIKEIGGVRPDYSQVLRYGTYSEGFDYHSGPDRLVILGRVNPEKKKPTTRRPKTWLGHEAGDFLWVRYGTRGKQLAALFSGHRDRKDRGWVMKYSEGGNRWRGPCKIWERDIISWHSATPEKEIPAKAKELLKKSA